MLKERIQKVVASVGVFSRREVEKLILAGKVMVNGKVMRELGTKVDASVDRISVNGKLVALTKEGPARVILFHKPRHVMVTRKDPEGRPTVFDYMPKDLKDLKPIGRLDFNTQGALLLTDDGELINHMTHPRYHVEKVYEVKLSSHPDPRQIKRLQDGILIDGRRTMPGGVNVISTNPSSTIVEFRLVEGRNRQIRRMCEAVGLTVKELRRLRIGPVSLGALRSGAFRALTQSEIRKLKVKLDLS
jgi:pseudouridine synthase